MTNDQLSNLVNDTEQSNLISGTPGSWSFNPVTFMHYSMTANLGGPADGGAVAAVVAPAPAVAASQAQLIQQAVDQSNLAARTTPVAATDQDVSSTTAQNIIDSFTAIGNIGADIAALEAGGTAHLHWWGWEATLDTPATAALERLLGQDATTLVAGLAALAAIIPVAAAIGGMLTIVAASLGADVRTADHGFGVNLRGYLWIGLHATSLAA